MSKFIITKTTDELTFSIEPTSVSMKKYHISNQERTMSGNLVVDYIATKNSLSATWSLLSDNEFKTLMELIELNSDSSDNFFDLEFVEPESENLKKIKAYADEISYYPYFLADGSMVWRDVSVDFVEV